MVRMAGFEPALSWSRTKHFTKLSYILSCVIYIITLLWKGNELIQNFFTFQLDDFNLSHSIQTLAFQLARRYSRTYKFGLTDQTTIQQYRDNTCSFLPNLSVLAPFSSLSFPGNPNIFPFHPPCPSGNSDRVKSSHMTNRMRILLLFERMMWSFTIVVITLNCNC